MVKNILPTISWRTPDCWTRANNWRIVQLKPQHRSFPTYSSLDIGSRLRSEESPPCAVSCVFTRDSSEEANCHPTTIEVRNRGILYRPLAHKIQGRKVMAHDRMQF